jgi:hypothetical protein
MKQQVVWQLAIIFGPGALAVGTVDSVFTGWGASELLQMLPSLTQ